MILKPMVRKAMYDLKNGRFISVRIQGKPISISIMQAYAPSTDAEETEIEKFYENLKDLELVASF